MNDKNRRRYERVVRSADYFDANPDIFPAGSKGAQALTRFRAAILDVENLNASLETGASTSKQGTLSRADARNRLKQIVNAITRTSQTIALDDPSFKGQFDSLRSSGNDQELLAVARSYATKAPPVKAKFIEYDMPTDFLDTLTTAIADLDTAINQQNEGATTSKSARASIDDALTRAEQELERCDTALRNKVTDAGALAAWESARRLERAPQKQKAKQVTAATASTDK
jgi:hypothetical protein